jgi:hypothetical protein
LDALSGSFINFGSEDFTTIGNLTQSTQANAKLLEAEQTRSHRRLLAHMNHADEIERQLQIEERWSAEDPRYLDALKYINDRTFIGAVERLEGLVVQRLFELSKANLAATGVYFSLQQKLLTEIFLGYKMRKHISKAIAKRSSAIRTALEKYNKLAPLQIPPRPILQFSDVASYSWLSDFDLLKFSRTDIMQKPWSVPANREVSNKYFKVLRAHEEIHRLNIEVRRLDAWITHENQALKSAADIATDPHLAAELRRCYAERRRVNKIHRIRLSAIYNLEGYSGPGPFVPASEGLIIDGDTLEDSLGSREEHLDEDDEEDDEEDDVLRLGDFLDALTIV